MEYLGHKLKAVRESRGMTVPEIAALTKISVQAIENIEDNTINKYYAPIYAKGFIKLYAEAVGMSADELADCVSKPKPGAGVSEKQEVFGERGAVDVSGWIKAFAGAVVGQCREWRVRIGERMSAAPLENEDDVGGARKGSLIEMLRSLAVRLGVSRKTLKTAVFCLALAGASLALVLVARRLSIGRLMDSAVEFEVVQEPPAPYIE